MFYMRWPLQMVWKLHLADSTSQTIDQEWLNGLCDSPLTTASRATGLFWAKVKLLYITWGRVTRKSIVYKPTWVFRPSDEVFLSWELKTGPSSWLPRLWNSLPTKTYLTLLLNTFHQQAKKFFIHTGLRFICWQLWPLKMLQFGQSAVVLIGFTEILPSGFYASLFFFYCHLEHHLVERQDMALTNNLSCIVYR